MQNEFWERWDHLLGIPHYIELKEFINDLNTFKVLLADCTNPESQFSLIFEHSSNFYQKSNYALWKKFKYPLVVEKNISLVENCAFYRVTNSFYMQQLEQQSFGFYQAKNSVLFVLITKNSVLEILAASTYSPLIEWHKRPS